MKHIWFDTKTTSHFSELPWLTNYAAVTITSKSDLAGYVMTKLAHGLTFNSHAEYSNAVSTLNSYVLGLEIPDFLKADISVKLQDFSSSYQSYAANISSSHGGVQVETTVRGTGILNMRQGHSWIEGKVSLSETYCPPEVLDPSSLMSTLRTWVDTTVSGITSPPQRTRQHDGGIVAPGMEPNPI